MKNGRYLIKNFVEKCLFSTILLIGLMFTTGSYYGSNVHVKLDDITVELGDKLPDNISSYMSILTDMNNLSFEDNVPKNEEGQTLEIGEFSYYLVYNDENYKFSKLTNIKAKVMVVDTVSPVITINEKKEFKYGNSITEDDVFTCDDLSGCTMKFNEEIDVYQSGEYDISVVATDKAGNISNEKTTITILEKPEPVYSYGVYLSSFGVMNDNNNYLNSTMSLEEKNNLRYKIIEYAKMFIGNPYVYGGTSLTNGTDCSGFTMGVYGSFGYNLPRVAVSQGYMGIPISESELLPGDLVVYYYGHVGIYAGGGMMVHAGTQETGITYAPVFAGNKSYRRIIY